MPILFNKNMTNAATLIVAIVFLGFSISSYQYARLLTSDDSEQLSNWNFFDSNRARQISRLNTNIADLENVLQYMVWPTERQKNQAKLLLSLQEKIKLKPFSSRDWQLLLAAQDNQITPLSTRLWSLRNAIKLNMWWVNSRPFLAYYCLSQSADLDKSLTISCNKLISELPWQNKPDYLANLIGVSRKQLVDALVASGK